MPKEKTMREILDNYAKYAFDEGMKCVKDNIDLKTGLWKLSKKFVDMTIQRNQALSDIEALRISELPKERKITHDEMGEECSCKYLEELEYPCQIAAANFNQCRTQAIKRIKKES